LVAFVNIKQLRLGQGAVPQDELGGPEVAVLAGLTRVDDDLTVEASSAACTRTGDFNAVYDDDGGDSGAEGCAGAHPV